MSATIILIISLVFIPAIILAWDFWLWKKNNGLTISRSVIQACDKSRALAAVIGVGFGLLFAHLFF
jgi:uncharacterized iron-regulated membrane protein